MKKLFLFLLLIPLFGIAQDWHPFPEGQTSLFSYKESTTSYLYSNITPIKIDSIQIDGNAEIYYNVRTPVIIGDNDDWVYYFDPMQSWIGYSTKIANGKAEFKNIDDETIYLEFGRNNQEPWLFYTYANGSYIQAQITDKIETEIVDGLIDSVKIISLESFDSNGLKMANNYSFDSIVISKNYGLVGIPVLVNFPIPYIQKIISIEKDGNHYGFNYQMNDFMASYEVGDTVQWLDVEDYELYIVYDKELSEDFVKYIYTRCSENGYLSEIEKIYYINRLPNQSIILNDAKGFYRSNVYLDDWNGKQEYGVQFYTNFSEREFNGIYVWAYDLWEGNNSINPPMSKVNDIFTFQYYLKYSLKSEITYYNNGDESWGEPKDFDCGLGLNELVNSKISISPNPSNGNFNIQSPQKIEELKVYNINGQIVWQVNKLSETQINLSTLPEGLYLLEIKTDNQELIHQKVVIKK